MKRLDFILITVYITISIMIGYLLLWGPTTAAELVEVKVNNELVGRYSLPLDTPLEVELDDHGHNLLVIDGYEVFMKDADCPDQLCVTQGSIEKPGTMIVCLPNKITVEIIGKRDDGVDIISY